MARSRVTPADVDKLLRKAAAIPGVLEQAAAAVERVVSGASRAADVYERAHWGRKGQRGAVEVVAADPGAELAIPTLGELCEVAYLTRKGAERAPSEYFHRFEGTRPLLCFAPNQGGKLIVAGGSYRVTERGIVG